MTPIFLTQGDDKMINLYDGRKQIGDFNFGVFPHKNEFQSQEKLPKQKDGNLLKKITLNLNFELPQSYPKATECQVCRYRVINHVDKLCMKSFQNETTNGELSNESNPVVCIEFHLHSGTLVMVNSHSFKRKKEQPNKTEFINMEFEANKRRKIEGASSPNGTKVKNKG